MLIAGFPAGSFQANCYVLAADKGTPALVVDPGEEAADRLRAVLAQHDLTPAAVLLTHGHLDHIADAAAVCREFDIPSLVHGGDEHLLDDPLAGLPAAFAPMLAGHDLTGLRPHTVETLAGGTTLELAGVTVRVDHVPGHTGGSVVYRIDADGDRPEVLFTGDTLFAGSVGRTDLPGGSHAQLLSSIGEHLLTRPDDAVVLPGHGGTSTIGQERRTNPFLTG